MNVEPDVVTIAVPPTLLPLSGTSFAVRVMGGVIDAAGDAAVVGVVFAVGDAAVVGGAVFAVGDATVVGGVVIAVGDAAAMGEVCATAWAPEAEWPPQAASATETIMVDTNRFCIRHVPATGCPCVRRRKRTNRHLAGSRSLSSVGSAVGLWRPAADRCPTLPSAPGQGLRPGGPGSPGDEPKCQGSFVSALEIRRGR